MPQVNGVLETALYVDDVPRARGFYETVMGLKPLFGDSRLCALDVAGRSVLLLFKRGASLAPIEMPGGTIPPHDASGQQHIALAVTEDELAAWERHLASHDVAIEGRTKWQRGGRSVYFRDLDGHLIELATPGLWAIY